MAVGGAIADNASVAAASYLTIQPGAGVTWLIKNITWPDAAAVSTYDGTNECIFHTDTAAGGLLGAQFILTNGDYMRVKNNHVSDAKILHYDGIIWAE